MQTQRPPDTSGHTKATPSAQPAPLHAQKTGSIVLLHASRLYQELAIEAATQWLLTEHAKKSSKIFNLFFVLLHLLCDLDWSLPYTALLLLLLKFLD